MFIVGLTGGIGSGKTAATDMFQELGINIVDADIVAREVVEPGKPALKHIEEHFGKNILLENKSLNRSLLRKQIFSNPEQKKWLENLLHPLIRNEILKQLKNSDSTYTILVSPLLFETNQSELVDRTLLIDVPLDTQIKRAMIRDDNTSDEIQKIIDSQLPRDVKLARASDVISNDQGLLELAENIKKQHEFYLELAHEKTT